MLEQPSMPADCNMACPSTWYARAEFLYLKRESDEGYRLTTADLLGLEEMDFTGGGRITVGYIRDCLEGFELRYIGPYEWTERSHIAGEDILPIFEFPNLDLPAFENAEEYRMEYRSDLHSAEINKKCWGWDVISTSYGLRYLYIGEKLQLDAISPEDGIGTYKVNLRNNLLGPQVGMDLFYTQGRWTSKFVGQAGAYANYVEGDLALLQDDKPGLLLGDDQVQFACVAEGGYYVNFQLLPRVSLQAGYELWWVYGAATATSQEKDLLDRHTEIETDDDFFYHGGSLGIEVVW
jgi:hypothetical protein